jgi:hypothetical protein
VPWSSYCHKFQISFFKSSQGDTLPPYGARSTCIVPSVESKSQEAKEIKSIGHWLNCFVALLRIYLLSYLIVIGSVVAVVCSMLVHIIVFSVDKPTTVQQGGVG